MAASTIKSVMAKFAALQKELGTASEPALKEAVQPVLLRSQALVPVDTGRLRASAFIATERTASGSRAVVGYARDGDPNYAVKVHEDLQTHHNTGQAKFLQTAANEEQSGMLDKFGRAIKSKTKLRSA